MRKKSARSKNEEKTHKHSRRRRKSSSSESETESAEVQDEQASEHKGRRTRKTADKPDPKELENNAAAAAGGRVTRHSRRLAAISAGSDELKESTPELLSPAKPGRNSPYSSASPNKDSRKKDGTPDRHKAKDTWTVESANGSGLQKLKIRLQRYPEATASEDAENEGETPDADSRETVEEKNIDEKMIEEVVVQVSEVSQNDIADIELPPSESNKIVDDSRSIASIELPPSEGNEAAAKSQPSGETRSDVADQVTKEIIEIENIELPPEPEPQPVINDVRTSEKKSPEAQDAQETVSDISLPSEQPPEEIPLPNECADVDKIEDDKDVEVEKEKDSTAIEVEKKEEIVEKSRMEVETAEPVTTSSEIVSSPQQALSEQEDKDSQGELVLTVEDNVMEEQTPTIATNEEDENVSTEKKDSETSKKKKSILPSISQVEMEDVYDYEQDDTREEGELSANEAMSPIHEVFKKLPAEERKRSWGACSVFQFNRNKIIVSEQVLKEHNIVKRVKNKDDLETSETEDLIFVKEIREENIVHDIESETGNNTSFTEKEYDVRKEEEVANTRRRHTLESDKILDKPSKRHSKESRMVSGEGKTVLYITNLVRPFTITQLRELLQRTGRIVENGFWIDSIKSKCYVQFENSDQAVETRHALHGIRWPVNNPKVLSVHFATPEELAAAQEKVHESESQRKEPLTVSNHNNDSSQKHIDWKKHFEQYDERPRKVKDVREWDIGKPAHPDEMMWVDDSQYSKKKEEAESTGRSRRDRKRRNELSDDETRTKRHKKSTNDTQPPAEAKLLDDLFRRTKASPSIYWLPLSEEQIAIKQEARRKHLEDISKQLKDRSGDREPRRRDRERRRSRR